MLQPTKHFLTWSSLSLLGIAFLLHCRHDDNPLKPQDYSPSDEISLTAVWNDTLEAAVLHWQWTGDDSIPIDSIYMETWARQDPWQLLGSVHPEDTVFLDNTPNYGQEYFYRAAVASSQLESTPLYSPRVTMKPRDYHCPPNVPIAPDSLICNDYPGDSDMGSVSIYWRDNSADEDSFLIQKRDLGLIPIEQWKNISYRPAGANSYSDFFVKTGECYSYRIRAVNGYGGSDWCGPFTIYITPPPPPPPDTTCGPMFCINTNPIDPKTDNPDQGTVWLWSEHGGKPHILDRHDFVCSEASISTQEPFVLNGRGECFEEMRLSTIREDNEITIQMQVRSLPVENQQLFHNLSVGVALTNEEDWGERFIQTGGDWSGYRWAKRPGNKPFPIIFGRWYDVRLKVHLENQTFQVWVNNRSLGGDVSVRDLLIVPCLLTKE
ncbi:MAG: fibronectin type III domain-containing protein [Calditrichota bacterium]